MTNTIITDDESAMRYVAYLNIEEGYVSIYAQPRIFNRKQMNYILSNTATWKGKYLTTYTP